MNRPDAEGDQAGEEAARVLCAQQEPDKERLPERLACVEYAGDDPTLGQGLDAWYETRRPLPWELHGS